MPGILPMKVIKMGTSASARIAQACDRCRSKKIRCDGTRPCCTQCAQVGFECKTSDKLRRRAFPRGYTESLEERVRSLETELRELKDVLDEKDEKIDMLSRIHPTRMSVSRARSISVEAKSPAPNVSATATDPNSTDGEDVKFEVQQPPLSAGGTNSETYYTGASSGVSLIEAFKHKVQEKGRSATDIRPSQLLKSASQQTTRSIATTLSPLQSRPPSRLTSDQLVNVFFQEWAPLFPILHRPTFLGLYEDFTKSQDRVTDRKSIAQLYLVFGLSALSQGTLYQAEMASFELQWQSAMQHVQFEQSFAALQCLVLAQLYCMQKGECNQMLTYKALAISLSSRLGLPHSQKRFAVGTLTCELRKRVFWTLCTIDSFSAVQLGLPPQITDAEILCELPADTDDEYITEKGFKSVPPGESTRVSSALALFRAARILSRVLTELYPGLPTYELSARQVSALGDELDAWLSSLAPHLRLPFAQDKPTVGTVSSRSPILSLVYHYIRCMIHRPAAVSSDKAVSSSATLALASSSKHIAQILGLLTERGLGFSLCVNKDELLVLSGFGLLLQSLHLDGDSKILKDNHKTLALIIGQLDKARAPSGSEFRRVASSFLPRSSTKSVDLSKASSKAMPERASEGSVPPAHTSTIPSTIKEQFKTMTSKLAWSDHTQPQRLKDLQRRMTVTGANPYRDVQLAQSQPNVSVPSSNVRQDPPESPEAIPANPHHVRGQYFAADAHVLQSRPSLNLDYLNFTSVPVPSDLQHTNGDWERLLGSIDNGQTNIFDNIYGGPVVDVLSHDDANVHKSMHRHSLANVNESLAWNPDLWAISGVDVSQIMTSPANPESVISFSSEDGPGYGSGQSHHPDDSSGVHDHDSFHNIIMPELVSIEDGIWASRDVEHAFVMS